MWVQIKDFCDHTNENTSLRSCFNQLMRPIAQVLHQKTCRVALGYHYIDGGSSLLANEHEYTYKLNKEKTSRISYENEIPLSKVINQETTGATKARINTKTDLYNNNKRGISKPERKGTKREQV